MTILHRGLALASCLVATVHCGSEERTSGDNTLGGAAGTGGSGATSGLGASSKFGGASALISNTGGASSTIANASTLATGGISGFGGAPFGTGGTSKEITSAAGGSTSVGTGGHSSVVASATGGITTLLSGATGGVTSISSYASDASGGATGGAKTVATSASTAGSTSSSTAATGGSSSVSTTLATGGQGGATPTGICSADDWCWENPLPQGNTFCSLWISPSGDVWGAGYLGVIMHRHGGNWSRDPSGTTDGLYAIAGRSDTDVWAVGTRGTLLRYDGATWVTVSLPITTEELNGIWFSESGEGWAVGSGPTLVHIVGNAANTVTAPSGVTETMNAVWGSSATDVWAVGNEQRILHYDGVSWTSALSLSGDMHLYAIWGRASNDVWAVGGDSSNTRAVALHWDGSRWTNVSLGYEGLHSICGPKNGTDAWSVSAYDLGSTLTILKVGGSTFSVDQSGVSGLLFALGCGDTDVWAAGEGGMLLHHDEASGWSKVSTTIAELVWLRAAWMAGPSDGWAVGGAGLAGLSNKAGTIFHFNGTRWQKTALPSVKELLTVHGTGSTDVWAGGMDGGVIHWDGQAWSKPSSYNYSDTTTAIWATAASDVWVATAPSYSPFYVRHWDGATWTSTGFPGTGPVTSLWSPAPGDMWAGGGAIYHYTGGQWVKVPGPIGVRALWGASSTDIWAVGSGGTIAHWNGSTFDTVTSPITEDLEAIAGSASNHVYASTENGTVLYWDGSTWKVEAAGGRVTAIAWDRANTWRTVGPDTAILKKVLP